MNIADVCIKYNLPTLITAKEVVGKTVKYCYPNLEDTLIVFTDNTAIFLHACHSYEDDVDVEIVTTPNYDYLHCLTRAYIEPPYQQLFPEAEKAKAEYDAWDKARFEKRNAGLTKILFNGHVVSID